MTLKAPWKDGTCALLFEPHDLLARLVAAIAPPRFHMFRYFGALSSHSKLRTEVADNPKAIARIMSKHGFEVRTPPPPHTPSPPTGQLRLRFGRLTGPSSEGDAVGATTRTSSGATEGAKLAGSRSGRASEEPGAGPKIATAAQRAKHEHWVRRPHYLTDGAFSRFDCPWRFLGNGFGDRIFSVSIPWGVITGWDWDSTDAREYLRLCAIGYLDGNEPAWRIARNLR